MELKETCNLDIIEGMKRKAIKSYITRWTVLKRIEFPTDIKWFYDDDGCPHLGLANSND